ncbi:MAG: LysM peptidoglycan-binding domain-containing protein [Candidatus Sericytochromatia bacterium]|nr:LysM peptidoglycan-binding domain-containing protein [Candidatus Sericytochromatia bacterium]
MSNPINSGAPRVNPVAGATVPQPTREAAPATRSAARDGVQLSRGAKLAELAQLIEETRRQLESLERAVSVLEGRGGSGATPPFVPAGPQLPPGVDLPPLPPRPAAPPRQPAASAAPAGTERVTMDAATWAGVPMDAVRHVIAGAKLENLTSQEAKVVRNALERVREIGLAVGRGERPGPYQAEMFALRHTLAEPGGAGRNGLATAGAQVIAQAETAKASLEERVATLEAKLSTDGDAATARALIDANARYSALVQIERALFSARLTGLDPAAQRTARGVVEELRTLGSQIETGAVDPVAADARVAQLRDQLLAAAPAAASTAAPAPAGPAAASARVDQAKAALRQQLAALDDKVVGGAPPETVAADRARLLAAAEALHGLGQELAAPRPAAASSAERAEQDKAQAQAAALADRLGRGEHPGALRAELYVARQSLKDPIGSKNNGAIQAAAAALRVIGQAEAANQTRREGFAAAVAGGVDPRTLDAQTTAIGRQSEDLEAMRLGIETADLRGLSPEQVTKGVGIIGQMQGIAEQVGGGADFGSQRKAYEGLVQQLQGLRQAPPAPPVAPVTPPVIPGAASQTPAGQPTSHTVKAGDYLSKIAREQLGDANRWREIVELNKAKYPSLAQNPDLIHPGWVLQLPPREGGAAAPQPAGTPPAAPQPGGAAPSGAQPGGPRPPAPQPAGTTPGVTRPPAPPPAGQRPGGARPPAPQPGGARPPAPPPAGPRPPAPQPPAPQPPVAPPAAPAVMSEKDAVMWLRTNSDPAGMVSRETVQKMPAGPAREALLKHFDTLLFGHIDGGEKGWSLLHKGDLDRLAKAVDQGQSITAFAEALTRQVIADNALQDQTGDGKVDGQDVAAFAASRRTTPAPTPRPVLTGDPRLQADLETFLAAPENRRSSVIRDTLERQPAYFEAASPAQKARVLALLVEGITTKKDRQAALKVLEMAEKRGEVLTTLHAASEARKLDHILSDLGDHSDGVRAAALLQRAGAYQDPMVWRAMDDDAVRGYAKAQGYTEPMIGLSETLGALSEEARKHMIAQLLGGNLTWEEHGMARWINQHNAEPVDIPVYNDPNQGR